MNIFRQTCAIVFFFVSNFSLSFLNCSKTETYHVTELFVFFPVPSSDGCTEELSHCGFAIPFHHSTEPLSFPSKSLFQ